MRKKVLIGVASLLAVVFLFGCGGVSQEDYDDAVADKDACQSQLASLQSSLDAANSAKTAAEADLATAEADLASCEGDLSAAQSAKTSAESAKAAAEAQVADLEAQLAECQAGEEEEEEEEEEDAGGLSFTAATYTNTDYGFSLQYPNSWEEKTDDPAVGVIWRVGDPATYAMPSVRVIVRDAGDGATLQAVFAKVLESDSKAITTFTASDVNINGTDFSKGEVVYPHASYGDYDSMVIGLIKNSKWVIIEVYTLPGLGAAWPDEGLQAEIIGTVTFD